MPIVALLVVIVGLASFGYLTVWSAPRHQGPTPYIRWLVIGAVVELAVWLGLIWAIGWRKAAGLVIGSRSWLGILPLVALSAASLATAGRAEEAWVGPGLQGAIAVGVFVAALTEEVAFRGFLFHGLTRRLGGATAVVVGSLLFAVYHVPYMVRNDIRGTRMILTLTSHFGFGLFQCRVRAQSRSIWYPTAIHTLWNLTIVEIGIWAIPDGQFPSSFAWIHAVISFTGLLIALGLLIRVVYARIIRSIVSGPVGKTGKRERGIKPVDWRSLLAALSRPPSPVVFERLTDSARDVVSLAQEAARSHDATVVGTEHLLFGLTHHDGLASEALEECGLQGGPAGVEGLFRDGDEPVSPPHFDTRANAVLQLAALEADAWKHPHIGTEHLLIALTTLRRSKSARILREQGIRLHRLRRTTLRLLAESESSVPARSPASNGDVEPLSGHVLDRL